LNIRLHISCACLLLAFVVPTPVGADTYVIPFSDIRQQVDDTGDPPDDVIRDYLTGLIREELDALGFNVNGGLVFADIPVDEVTQIIETDCDFLTPYEVHTDATTANVTIDDSSSLTLNLDNIRSVSLQADLTGTVSTQSTAWVRWGQDIIFIGDCLKINTDHGWVGLTLPFNVTLDLALDLDPSFDSGQLAVVVQKHATLAGQAQITGGNLQHDFGFASLTDLVISVFEDELLEKLRIGGEQAVADGIVGLNYRLDGLDDNGVPDPNITAFNGPTTFLLDVDEDDQAFVQDLLAELGIPDLVITILDDRGIEILLQLAILEGAEKEAYLAELGATVSCDALLNRYELQLDVVPIYTLNGQFCEAADLSGPNAASYFSDAACTNEVAYEGTDENDFCLTRFGDQAEYLLGNATAWVADTNQPNDPLPNVPSRPWTTIPSTRLDLGVVSVQDNHQPYMKQLNYKTITGLSRGSGTCELEMRVYKSDMNAQNLRPLLALHGGTWRHRGFSFFGLEAGISQFTERGFVVFAPFYRLVGESDGNTECNGASWREVTADVTSALDWIKANGPALGATNSRINVFGQSAGAHLAAWLASHRSGDVWQTLLFYAPTDALDFLTGAAPLGGPYDAYRGFGLDSLARFFGAHGGRTELLLEQIDFAGITIPLLADDWQTLIPDTVFDLSQIDPLAPPLYVAKCAAITQINLSAINLALPPTELTYCMKQELSEFLIENSFIHQLEAEPVPIHVLHGSGDTLVPYQQALKLCGAIDNTLFPDGVYDPLTRYRCGQVSEVQIVKDAEHALELGVCLGSICPAGEPGSPTNAAVATAIEQAYSWLDYELILVRETPIDYQPPKKDPNPIWFTDGNSTSANNSAVAERQPEQNTGALDWLMLLCMMLMYFWHLHARRINRERQAVATIGCDEA
jgi:acetyl esterase/lipase